ncbi:MAG: flagellar hook-associated protein FlgL [Planctomycetaceae bacterium]
MGISPILPGRIPNTLLADRLRQNIQTANHTLAYLQQQVATGQRFFRPGEDPSAAIRTILLQKSIERTTQLKANVDTNVSLLNATENSLSSVGDALNKAKALLIAGTGETTSAAEKEAMAVEVASMLQSVVNAANTKFRGRYIFGGSESQLAPFDILGSGVVRYNGDSLSIDSFIDTELLLSNNLDGVTAFGAMTAPVGNGLNPALTLNTNVSDLLGGEGVKLGQIVVTVDDGGAVTRTVDLSNATTIGHIKTAIESAFDPGDITVDIVAGPPRNGIRITPAGGTVAVSEVTGSKVATRLGILSGPVANINGTDLDPRLTLTTPLSALNGGLGATKANGIVVTNGQIQKTIDISSANTVEDLFNLLRSENLELDLGINAAGDGLAISSRLSGADFSIGENGGGDAASLGIRTFSASMLLADMNLGRGVPVNNLDAAGNLMPAIFEITRRSGATVSVDLKGLTTIQDVINAINTIAPGEIVASVNAVGNGISIRDNDGASTGPLIIPETELSKSLGLNGTESGTDATVPIVGREINPRQANGVINLLLSLESALRNGDNRELERLDSLFSAEIERMSLVRGDVGSRLKVLETAGNRLLDEDIVLRESLAVEFEVDMTQAITNVAQTTTTLQATLQIAAQSLQISLLNFL